MIPRGFKNYYYYYYYYDNYYGACYANVCQNTGCGFLLNSMFDFAERFNELRLSDEEIALFSALIIISAGNSVLPHITVITVYSLLRRLHSVPPGFIKQ